MAKARAQQESESIGVLASRPAGGDFVPKNNIANTPSDFRMSGNN